MNANIHGLGKRQREMVHRLYREQIYNCTLDTGNRYRMARLAQRGLACKSGAVWIISVDGAWAMERGLV